MQFRGQSSDSNGGWEPKKSESAGGRAYQEEGESNDELELSDEREEIVGIVAILNELQDLQKGT